MLENAAQIASEDRAENAGLLGAEIGGQLQQPPRGQGHTLNHELRNAVLAALGIETARQLADTLTHFGATQAEREHVLYPLVLDALKDGIHGVEIAAADLPAACADLVRKFPDTRSAHGCNMRSCLSGYLRIAAMRRREQERDAEETSVRESAARHGRSAAPKFVSTRAALGPFAERLPDEYREMKTTAERLAMELQVAGRPGSDLARLDTIDAQSAWREQWPTTFLVPLGPWPLREPGEEG